MDRKKALWLVSFPKSGNTWTVEIIRKAAARAGFSAGEDYDIYNLIGQSRPFVPTSFIAPAFADEACFLLKTHSAFDPDSQPHADLGFVTEGFIHIYRNPLDVLLSYINFTRIEYYSHQNDAVYQRELFLDLLGLPSVPSYAAWNALSLDTLPRENLDHALSQFMKSELAIPSLTAMSSSWIKHTQSWIEAANRGTPSAVLKYEECLVNPSVFNRMDRFFSFGPSVMSDAVQEANEFLKKKSATSSKELKSEGHTNIPEEAIFFNKMTSCYYINYFSRPLLSSFMSEYGQVLREFGYIDLPY
ncbi:MAG: hypothetical protein FD157_4039 [Rhodocyclaceae bacterium]|nr:MAG: hypothetical protein FD157_4039 [Rhodocyclaceae bacterium]TNC98521.1 MAG: hypothetical protein FD118_4025 [Rhodocyclaceae bacterium]